MVIRPRPSHVLSVWVGNRVSMATESLPFVSASLSPESVKSFYAVERDPHSWAGAMPANQGLYLNENEKDSCGVGFVCHIKGEPTHKIVSDARQLLCAMTHRGATGADSRDGDGAGVMTAIPHEFFKREAETEIGCTLPEPGEYAVGNVFFKANDPVQLQSSQAIFSKIALDLGLRVLGWRQVPADGTILGPAASSKEPTIVQPFVVLRAHYGDGPVSQRGTFDAKYFERQLYVLRKHATHTMFVIFLSTMFSKSMLTSIKILLYQVHSPRDSTFVPCHPRISCTRASFHHLKYTTTIMISIMSSIDHILPWSTRVSQQIRFPAGIVHNPCDGPHTTVCIN